MRTLILDDGDTPVCVSAVCPQRAHCAHVALWKYKPPPERVASIKEALEQGRRRKERLRARRVRSPIKHAESSLQNTELKIQRGKHTFVIFVKMLDPEYKWWAE